MTADCNKTVETAEARPSSVQRLVRRIYWRLGFDLMKPWTVISAIPRIWNRPFDHLPLRGVGAEVGVFRGIHAAGMLRAHPEIERLWLVDAYEPYFGVMPLLQEAEADAKRRLRGFSSRVQWLRESSPGCAAKLPPLDFCYLDGEHTYEAVVKDIAAMWPKVKAGGIMGGHDFSPEFRGVIRAVTEFAVSYDLPLMAETPDWWIEKPNNRIT